jgi:tetratricopeptide (TPR) repeat protein
VAGFEQALVALQHLPDTREMRVQAIDLWFDLRNTLLLLGEHERIFDYMREAEALAKGLDDNHRHAQVSAYLCTYFFTAGNYDQAIASGKHALAITTSLGDFPLHVDLNFRLGQVYHAIGEYQRAMACLRRNVESLIGEQLYERIGQGFLLSVFSRAWLVWCLAEVGEFDEGLSRGEEGIQVAEAVDQPFSLIAAYYSVGSLYLQQGDFHQAIPVLERNLALCQAANNRLFFPLVASGLGCALAYTGALAAAFPLLEQAVEQVTSMHTVFGHAVSVARLSEVSLLAGRMEDARQLAARALDLARAHKERGRQAWALRLLGESLAHGDPHEVEQAEDHYQQARALAEELGMRPLLAHCHLGLGTLHSQVGRLEQARVELATAMALYRSMAMTFWLSQAEAALVRMA